MSQASILMLTSTYPRHAHDAEPRFVADLAKHLVAQGQAVHVLAPHAKDLPLFEVLDGVPVYRFVYALPAMETLAYEGGILARLKAAPWRYLLVPLFLLSQGLWVCVLHCRFRYALIHAHWIIPQGIVAVLFSKLLFWRRLPVLVTSHGGDLFSLRGGVLAAIKGRVIRQAQGVTVVSNAMRDVVLAQWPGAQVRVRSMGVDLTQRFVPAEGQMRTDILYVGRLVEKKGVHVLLDALAVMMRDHGECPAAVIVGDGPERQVLEQQAQVLGLSSVRFTGSLPQDQLPAVYASALIAVMPSVVAADGDQEGLGLVAIEAMGCGVPVVASDLPAIRDAVVDGETGRLFPAGDAEALAITLHSLMRDAPAREALASSARQRAKALFGWEQVAADYKALYHELISE